MHNSVTTKNNLLIKLTVLAVLFLAIWVRVWRLDTQPPGLYWEEVALGYDAYSISETGRDHHGNRWPIVAFESFGDWKPSLYFYAVVPWIKLLGLSAWSVRLPSALAGTGVVVGVGILLNQIMRQHSRPKYLKWLWPWIPVVGMFLTAISPWAVLFSRGGWEVNLATFLLLFGLILGLEYQTKSNSQHSVGYLLGSVLLLCLAMYAYHAARIVAPLLGFGLAVWWITTIPTFLNKQRVLHVVLGAGLTLLLLLPFLWSLGTNQTTQRFAETALLSDTQYVTKSNHYKELSGNSWISRLLYHRYAVYTQAVVENAASHLEPGFLFLHGDGNPRHSVQLMGQLYHVELLFLVFGLGWWVNSKSKIKWLMAWWLVVGLLPAAITKAAPHALRTLPVMPLFLVTITFGLWQVVLLLEKTTRPFPKNLQRGLFSLACVAVLVVYGLEWWRFQVIYWNIYPKQYGQEWQVGAEAMVKQVAAILADHPDWTATISRAQGRPAMYYWFYNQIDPRLVQLAEPQAAQDQGEFLEFQQLRFGTAPTVDFQPQVVAEWTVETGWVVQ